jgi:DNA-binding beta-propeller fold protein YncE
VFFVSVFSSAASAGAGAYLAVIEKIAGATGFYGADGRQPGQVKAGGFPHQAVLCRDGSLLYISDSGALWMTGDGRGANTISSVDAGAMKKAGDIDLGRFHLPHGMALVPASNRLLAVTERPFGLVPADPAARKVGRDHQVKGKGPRRVIPALGGEWGFVSKQELTGAILTGKGPDRIAITPDGKTLVCNLQLEPGAGVAGVAPGKQVALAPLGGGPLSLTMTRDGRRAFASVQDADRTQPFLRNSHGHAT